MSLKSINPYTNQVIRETEELSMQDVSDRIRLSSESFTLWRKTSFKERNAMLHQLSALLKSSKLSFAACITAEMGKPVREAVAEIEKCAWLCEYYVENAESFLHTEKVISDAADSYVSYEPLGTILGIMPWNFPFWQVFRFAIPTVMAGNTVLLKHASNVQWCATLIEKAFKDAGFPDNVFQNLAIGSDRMQRIIEDDRVKAVSLTGSELAGQKVAGAAGSKIKKTVLELGGSNAFVVLEDADLEKAVDTGISARMQNGGQSCIAAKRFIIHEKVSKKFIAMFTEKVKKLHSGDPMEESTDIGPLCSIQQARTVENQVRTSVEMGAKIIEGCYSDSAFYPPTVIINVKPGMPVFDEEVFGPIAPIIIARDTGEAIALSNNSRFGLGVSLFTSNLEKAREMVQEFNEGAVFINALVKSDPRLPFGGVKQSGYGRELSVQGIREFVNTKTVYIKG
jgi:succinate-semialdehyde dehydrogenase/glutarate-semialdehyde dehydrogenase